MNWEDRLALSRRQTMNGLTDLALQVGLTINAVMALKCDDPEYADGVMGHLECEAADMREVLADYVRRLKEMGGAT